MSGCGDNGGDFGLGNLLKNLRIFALFCLLFPLLLLPSRDDDRLDLALYELLKCGIVVVSEFMYYYREEWRGRQEEQQINQPHIYTFRIFKGALCTIQNREKHKKQKYG